MVLFTLGKPTLEKCKKLRKKIEREREVAELDLGNIIDSNGKYTKIYKRISLAGHILLLSATTG